MIGKRLFAILFLLGLMAFIHGGCKGSGDGEGHQGFYVDITAPQEGSELHENNPHMIEVSAGTDTGTIASVSFFIDNVEMNVDTEAPYSWRWFTYREDWALGDHTIKVVATDSSGDEVSDQISCSIIAFVEQAPPVADFDVDADQIALGDAVQFTDLSSNAPDSWLWNFGDGTTSTQQNPSHVYSQVGEYMVSLEATNAYGSDTAARNYGLRVYDMTDYDEGPCTGTETVTDADGNLYATLKLGAQCWMAQNLNVGVLLVNSSAATMQTDNSTTEKYCYDNVAANCDEYGGLYQWDEMMAYTPGDFGDVGTMQGICPDGWHIPTDAEWKTLEKHLGMSAAEADAMDARGFDIGGKLKESGADHWENGDDTFNLTLNSSGFTALPSGSRGSTAFLGLATRCAFWSASDDPANATAYCRELYSADGNVYRDYCGKEYGYSVRCVKD